MINLAESGMTCECGGSRFAPRVLDDGGLCVCASCARVHRVRIVLTPAPWSAVIAEYDGDTLQRYEMDWTRRGVPEAARRTLAELAATGGRFRASDRAGALLAVVLLALVAFTVARVFS